MSHNVINHFKKSRYVNYVLSYAIVHVWNFDSVKVFFPLESSFENGNMILTFCGKDYVE